MSIFQTAQDQDASGQNQSALNDLVGDGKKFKTTDDLAKAKIESDRFIERLQNEQREARETLARQQAELEALKTGRSVTVEHPAPSGETPAKTQTQQPDITSEVEKVLRAREQTKSTQDNIATVTAKMTEVYGSVTKAAEVIQAKARELNTTVEDLQQEAQKNPTKFFRLIGLNDQKSVEDPKTSSWGKVRNPSAMAATGQSSTVQPGTYKWYQELRRSDPATYFSPRVQLEMDKAARDAKARGVDFTTT